MMTSAHFKSLISLPEWDHQVFVLHSHRASGPTLIALGSDDVFRMEKTSPDLLDALQNWIDQKKDWAFGFLAYDLKNGIEQLSSRHPNHSGFPELQFIRPKLVISIKENDVLICKNVSSLSKEDILDLISLQDSAASSAEESIELKPRITQDAYISAVRKLLHHIQQGDIYEVNYCQEFFAPSPLRDPFALWQTLNSFTEAPFAAYMQSGPLHLMCASPERFMQKTGERIISQPIKGTIRRGKNEQEDTLLKESLLHNPKERSENVMIVDLVRNDLSHFALKGSVEVEELFGIHSFKTVHHMISTVKAIVREGTSFTDILRAMFPMGSMTGAPKIRAMELIDQYEYNRRGLYSGSVGYITPEGDFDFNVVIRSLVYNASLPYLSCSVGSAITSQCDPEKEYEECLLKAEALFKSLQTQDAKTTSSDSHIARTAN